MHACLSYHHCCSSEKVDVDPVHALSPHKISFIDELSMFFEARSIMSTLQPKFQILSLEKRTRKQVTGGFVVFGAVCVVGLAVIFPWSGSIA